MGLGLKFTIAHKEAAASCAVATQHVYRLHNTQSSCNSLTEALAVHIVAVEST